MAAVAVLSPLPTSFVYEDLVSRVETMQLQMNKVNAMIEERTKTNKKVQRQLESRSFIFIDPFGNRMINRELDHQSLHKILQKYKRDYCPRYLHAWIQIGFFNVNQIQVTTTDQLKKTVSQYPDGQIFITYGKIGVRIVNEQLHLLQETYVTIVLNDNRETFENSIRELRERIRGKLNVITRMELKLCESDSSIEGNERLWSNGRTLEIKETVLSTQLYQKDTFIMAQIIEIG